jgi:hypothetical protein
MVYSQFLAGKNKILSMRIILLNTRKKGIERYAMVSEVLEPRKIPMDIIVKTPAEIKKREHYFDPFIKNIMTKGRVLYEKAA